MSDIVIAKARVISIEEVTLKAPTSVYDPTGNAPTKTVIASKLNVEPVGETDGFTAIHGTMTIPGHLPFGETFDLVLRERDGSIAQTSGRKFQEA